MMTTDDDNDDQLRVNDEYNKETKRSSDEDESESDRTDAVDDCSCQHPVVLQLIFLVIFVVLLFSL